MENNTNNTTHAESFNAQGHQPKNNDVLIKINTKTAIIVAVVIVAVIAVGVLAYLGKGLVIAATVDGSLISRLAVIQELEKASGKSSLDSLITKKIIQNEATAKKIAVGNDEISAELKKIENQIAAQGGTLNEALASRGMTIDDLKKQIVFQKQMEKLIADKITVTDEEAAQYIKTNSIPMTKGQEATTTAQIKDEIRNQKMSTEASALIAALKAKAKIRYFVKY